MFSWRHKKNQYFSAEKAPYLKLCRNFFSHRRIPRMAVSSLPGPAGLIIQLNVMTNVGFEIYIGQYHKQICRQ